MPETYTRYFPRYATRHDVKATLHPHDGSEEKMAKPLDISCGGAYLSHIWPQPGPAKLTFSVPDITGKGEFTISRDCDVFKDRSSPAGGGAVRFRHLLNGEELAMLAADPLITGSLDLAREDYNQVNAEILAIRKCRSNIFLGTMAAIATWLMAATGLFITNKLTDTNYWIIIGAALPFALLTIGILATIEKARALNYRRGFLAAITEYLRHDVPPPNYLGWTHLYQTRSECRARRASKLCPSDTKFCWEDDQAKHADLTRKKFVLTNPLDSFTAFSSLVYGILYAITCAIMIAASLRFLERFESPPTWCAWLEGVAFLPLAALLFRELYRLRKSKNSVEAHFLCWRAVLRYCKPIARSPATEEQPPINDSPRKTPPNPALAPTK